MKDERKREGKQRESERKREGGMVERNVGGSLIPLHGPLQLPLIPSLLPFWLGSERKKKGRS